jgi:hypothetical protein
MKSQTFPKEMRPLARGLPIIEVTEEGEVRPFVSGLALYRLTRRTDGYGAWTLPWWVQEHHAWVRAGLGRPMVQSDDGLDMLIHARLAATMAYNSGTDAGTAVSAYLRHAEMRWRIRTGGALSALEVAEEYDLIDRRSGATKRIGDALVNYAARADDVPRVTTIVTGEGDRRGFPSGLVEAWFRCGGGEELIEEEKMRPPKPRKGRAAAAYLSAREVLAAEGIDNPTDAEVAMVEEALLAHCRANPDLPPPIEMSEGEERPF